MKKTSALGINLIKEFEGFSATRYLCPGGKLTIGYGHVIREDERDTLHNITKLEAESLLTNDVCVAEDAICRLVNVSINQNQYDALVSFIYNVGVGAFARSTLLRHINNGEFEKAAEQFQRWIYSSGKKLSGLIRRREAEAELFTTPE
ncbi:MAG: lysozyme [Rickettsiales bacterium]